MFVVVLCWHQSGWAYSLNSHVSITFQPFFPGSGSFPINVFCHGTVCHWSQFQTIIIMPTLSLVRYALTFMSQIYGMESLINTTQAQTVWSSHVSTIKWGSLTFTQLSQVCCHGIYCHNCTTKVNNAICKKRLLHMAVYYGRWLIRLA